MCYAAWMANGIAIWAIIMVIRMAWIYRARHLITTIHILCKFSFLRIFSDDKYFGCTVAGSSWLRNKSSPRKNWLKRMKISIFAATLHWKGMTFKKIWPQNSEHCFTVNHQIILAVLRKLTAVHQNIIQKYLKKKNIYKNIGW